MATKADENHSSWVEVCIYMYVLERGFSSLPLAAVLSGWRNNRPREEVQRQTISPGEQFGWGFRFCLGIFLKDALTAELFVAVGEGGSVARISSRQVLDNQGRENARLPNSESCGPVATCPPSAAGKSTCVTVEPVVILFLLPQAWCCGGVLPAHFSVVDYSVVSRCRERRSLIAIYITSTYLTGLWSLFSSRWLKQKLRNQVKKHSTDYIRMPRRGS